MSISRAKGLMKRSMNTVVVVKPQRTGPTARPVRREEQSVKAVVKQIAVGAEVMCGSEDKDQRWALNRKLTYGRYRLR